MGTDQFEDLVPAGVGPPSPRHALWNPVNCKEPSPPGKTMPETTGPVQIDLNSWGNDLRRLHMTLDQVVQGFVANQTCQLDAVASELVAQRDRILAKEQCFAELSDSIANFVETEAARTELWGLSLDDAEADARHEAYDAELPGPPALHRINRLWRKMTRAFEVMKEAKEREASKELSYERERLELLVAAADARCETLRCEHANEVEALNVRLESVQSVDEEKGGELEALRSKMHAVTEQCEAAERLVAEMSERLEQSRVANNRSSYEWDAEREELIRERSAAQAIVTDLKMSIEASEEQKAELAHQVAERGEKLGQMRKIMDDQEQEMTQKIDRVQQYVKERQASALVAEKKQKDAERMADRWQSEVQRVQAEKDRLAVVVLECETHKSGQAKQSQGAHELHQQEINRLQEVWFQKEKEMQSANMDLLQKQDAECQSKITLERQREKDRSIALLNKKQQEMQIKDQQLKAARQRVQELESGMSTAGAANGRGSPAGRRPASGDASLPPLPLSAR